MLSKEQYASVTKVIISRGIAEQKLNLNAYPFHCTWSVFCLGEAFILDNQMLFFSFISGLEYLGNFDSFLQWLAGYQVSLPII